MSSTVHLKPRPSPFLQLLHQQQQERHHHRNDDDYGGQHHLPIQRQHPQQPQPHPQPHPHPHPHRPRHRRRRRRPWSTTTIAAITAAIVVQNSTIRRRRTSIIISVLVLGLLRFVSLWSLKKSIIRNAILNETLPTGTANNRHNSDSDTTSTIISSDYYSVMVKPPSQGLHKRSTTRPRISSPQSSQSQQPSRIGRQRQRQSKSQQQQQQQQQEQKQNEHPYKGAMDEFGNWGYVHDPKILWKKHHHQHPPPPPLPGNYDGQDLFEPSSLCDNLLGIIGHKQEDDDDNSRGQELARQIFGGHIQISSTASSSSSSQDGQQQKNQQQEQSLITPTATTMTNTSSSTTTTTTTKNNPVRIMCAIYSHPGGRNQTDAIRQTWGKRCDGIFISSTETVRDQGIVKIPHSVSKQSLQGKYDGLWQRVRSMLVYLYDNFVEDFDFFVLCGDDTYIIMENLRQFLTSPKFVQDAGGPTYPNPMYVGAPTHPFWKKEYGDKFHYNGGGASYIINARTLQLFVENVVDVCHSKTNSPVEDLLMGECLQKYMNLTGYEDTRDELGRERFFVYDVIDRAKVLDADEARRIGHQIPTGERHLGTFIRRQIHWLETFKGWTPKYGLDAISTSSISFHRVSPASKMIQYDRLLYASNYGRTNNNEQRLINNLVEDCGNSSKKVEQL